MKSRSGGDRGYTLVELLLVLAVMGALSSLAVYAGAGAVKSAQTARYASGAMGHIRLAQQHAIEYHLLRRVRFDPASQVGSGYSRYIVEWYTDASTSSPQCDPDLADAEEVADLGAGIPSKFASEVTVDLPEGYTVEVSGARDLGDGRGPMVYFDCTGKPALLPAGNVTISFLSSGTARRTVTIQKLSGRVLD